MAVVQLRHKSSCFPFRQGGIELLLLIFLYTISPSVLGQSNIICPSSSFLCIEETDKKTICAPPGWRCDGKVHCKDGIDEVNCTTAIDQDPKCGFRCDNGECIHAEFHCDSVEDCSDGSDEIGCIVACDYCQNGGHCIQTNKYDFYCVCQGPWTGRVCDVVKKPEGTRCSRNEFKCDDGHCIIGRFRCDGKPNCPDGSDEENCTSIVPSYCTGQYLFLCKNYECIDRTKKCDGFEDCNDGSDEANCDGNIVANDNSSEGIDNYIYINSNYQTITYTIICSLVMLVVIIVFVVLTLHHYRRRLRCRYQLAMANIRRRQRPLSNIYVPSLPTIQAQIDGQADPEQTHVLLRYSINNGVQIITLGEDPNTVSMSSTSQSSQLCNDEAPPAYWDVVQRNNSTRSSSSSTHEGSSKSSDSPPPPYPGLQQNQTEDSS